jgi:hypothetical protein
VLHSSFVLRLGSHSKEGGTTGKITKMDLSEIVCEYRTLEERSGGCVKQRSSGSIAREVANTDNEG